MLRRKSIVSSFLKVVVLVLKSNIIRIICIALAGVAQWVEHQPANPKAAISIPQSGHMPGLRARSPVGCVQEATSQCFSCTLVSLSLSPSL